MGSPQSHVVVAAFPYGTHAAPLLSLTTALATIAPSLHFSFLSTDRSLASLPHPPLSTNISFVPISDGLMGHSVPENIEARIGLYIKSFKDSLRDALKDVEVAVGCTVSCVISDAFLWMAGDVAKEKGLTWVPVWTGGPQALSAHMHTDSIRETVGVGDEAIESYGDKKIDFVPGLSDHRACDLQEGVIKGDIDSPFSVMLHQMARRLPDSDAIVLNTFQGLDLSVESCFARIFTNYFPTGPFHLLNSSQSETPSDPYGCLSWLDQQEPATVVYISLGTVIAFPPSELTALASGLESSNVPFIWSLKENSQSLLPPGFIDRTNATGIGKIVSWAPQKSVLEHNAVGVFVCHCGWNSVMESIAAGVPIICRPFFGDQIVNARAISHVWKFGIALDGGNFTEKGVACAIEAMLKGAEGKTMRRKACELKDMASAAITQHGSSRNNLQKLTKIICGC